MTGKDITLTAKDGGKFDAYITVPAGGQGPGLVLIQEIFGVNAHMRSLADLYAEEGYIVLAPDLFWRIAPGTDLGYSEQDFQAALELMGQFDTDRGIDDIAAAIAHLRGMPECRGGVGTAGFCLGGKLAYLAAARTDVDCAVGYYGVGIENLLEEAGTISCPLVLHFAELDGHVPQDAVARIKAGLAERNGVEIYDYPGADHGFNCWDRPSYDKPSAMMAHTRTFAALRQAIGPRYDLGALWDEHCAHEFGTRDVDATMATMVAQPYVNHIPTMTGGVGYDDLHRFYKNHFIPKTPQDTRLVPVSRTIGADRVVDEMLFCFTHDVEIDWMLPGLAPTGKYVEIPLVAIVCFRGDKLYHEHIYWDQASVLAQIGMLETDGLPVAGVETAKKLVDETQPSNGLMARWSESAP